MKLQENDIMYIYIVIAVIYTSSAIIPNIIYIVRHSTDFAKTLIKPNSNSNSNSKEDNNRDNKPLSKTKLFLQLLLECFFVLAAVIAIFVLVYVAVFVILLATTDVSFMDNFKNTMKVLNQYLWKDGDLLPIYVPFVMSIIVVFIVMSLYLAGSKSFLKDLTYVDFKNTVKQDNKVEDEDAVQKSVVEDEDNDVNEKDYWRFLNQDINKTEMFRRYFVLMIMLVMLFLFMFLFIHYWDTDKVMFMMYMSFMVILMMCVIVSMKQGYWNLFFYIGVVVCAGANYYILMSDKKN
jgi:MFS family permease